MLITGDCCNFRCEPERRERRHEIILLWSRVGERTGFWWEKRKEKRRKRRNVIAAQRGREERTHGRVSSRVLVRRRSPRLKSGSFMDIQYQFFCYSSVGESFHVPDMFFRASAFFFDRTKGISHTDLGQ
jgi:hypothetical protein